MSAIAEAPAAPAQKPVGQSSMRSAFAEAHAKSAAAGGVDGTGPTQEQRAAMAAKTAADAVKPVQPAAKTEAPADPAKGQEAQKPAEKSVASMFDKLKSGEVEEIKAEPTKPEKDPATLTKEEKAENSYRKLRQERDAFEKELKEIREKVGDTDVPALKKQLADLEKLATERQQKLAARDVAESEAFQQHVAQPSEAILTELHNSSKKFGFSWKEFVDAVEKPTPDEREVAIDGILSAAENEIPSVTKLKLLSRVNEYLQRQEYGEQLLRNAQKAAEAIKAEEARRAQEAKEGERGEYERVSNIVLKHITSDEYLESMPFLTKEKDGKRVLDESKIDALKKSLAYQDKEEHHIKALKTISAEILPLAIKENESLRSTVKSLEDRIAKLTGASPSISSSEASAAGGGDEDGVSLQEKLRRIRTGR